MLAELARAHRRDASPSRSSLGRDTANIGVSVGMATALTDEREDLVSRADFALYDAKESGRNTYRVFDEIKDRGLADGFEHRRQPRLAHPQSVAAVAPPAHISLSLAFSNSANRHGAM